MKRPEKIAIAVVLLGGVVGLSLAVRDSRAASRNFNSYRDDIVARCLPYADVNATHSDSAKVKEAKDCAVQARGLLQHTLGPDWKRSPYLQLRDYDVLVDLARDR